MTSHHASDRSLLWRALLAFLALPGVVAFLVPLLLAPDRPAKPAWHWIGVLPLLTGIALLLWCVREFYIAGRGTLAPWSPSRHLVVSGPYRHSRNPMYVAVTLILIGWALWFWSRDLTAYAVIVAVAFPMRIVLFEEPWLARTHGQVWERYAARTRRWM